MEMTMIAPGFVRASAFQHFPASIFPSIHPVDWLHSHFAVGGWSPLQRLSGMFTAHMTAIAPHSGFTWHPHRGLEIYTWVLEGTLHHEDTTGGDGDITAGELQRMFSGDWIEHQELNQTGEPVRVIQIWFAANPRFRGLDPHYQQLRRGELPVRGGDGARVHTLIGPGSPIESHVDARLEAISVEAGGSLELQPPNPGEDLFLYVTDGQGKAHAGSQSAALEQYDVILMRPDARDAGLQANGQRLDALAFYLPTFMRSA